MWEISDDQHRSGSNVFGWRYKTTDRADCLSEIVAGLPGDLITGAASMLVQFNWFEHRRAKAAGSNPATNKAVPPCYGLRVRGRQTEGQHRSGCFAGNDTGGSQLRSLPWLPLRCWCSTANTPRPDGRRKARADAEKRRFESGRQQRKCRFDSGSPLLGTPNSRIAVTPSK